MNWCINKLWQCNFLTNYKKILQQEFLVQLLHEEKAKAEALVQSTPGGQREKEMSSQLLADPLVFIRRWIGEVSFKDYSTVSNLTLPHNPDL